MTNSTTEPEKLAYEWSNEMLRLTIRMGIVVALMFVTMAFCLVQVSHETAIFWRLFTVLWFPAFGASLGWLFVEILECADEIKRLRADITEIYAGYVQECNRDCS